MAKLETQPEIVGREHELGTLEQYLDSAVKGKGKTLFISGEAGIGKTRLVNELKSAAQSKGFKVLTGNSLYEGLTPYMPFMEALKSGGLTHLFAEETPRVEAVYLVTDTGLLVKEVLREETELDPDIFTSMLTTVGDFVKDSLSMLKGREGRETLNKLGYGDYTIIIESGEIANLVTILKGAENEFLVNDMREILAEVAKHYGSILKHWQGEERTVRGIEKLLQPLVTSGKYDGIYYGSRDPKARRDLLFENVSLGLTRQAKTTPMLLCLEDLHWADPSTIALMHYVARNTRNSGLMIIGTFRPEEVVTREGKPHHLMETLQLMSREELYNKLELKRLSHTDLENLLQSLFKKTEFTQEFKDQFYRETEGNPLFIIELIKMLVEEKTIDKKDDVWVLTKDLIEANIPSKIYDVVVRRLNRLQEKEREILDYAAVVGDEFTSDVLTRTLELNKVQLLKQIRTLEQTHKLIYSFDTRFRFDHAKIREVLYNEIPLELRMEYHSMIAKALEGQYKDRLDDVIVDLAFHYYSSGNKVKAIPYLLRAADKAKKEFANKEAIGFYNEALELIGEDKDFYKEQLMALEERGDVCLIIGEYANAMHSFESMRVQSKDKETIARAYRKIGTTLEKKGEYERALGELSKGLEVLQGMIIPEQGRIIACQGNVYSREGRYEDALSHCLNALNVFEKSKAADKDVADAFNKLGIVHWFKGEYDKAIEYYEKSLEKRKRIGDQEGIAASLMNIGIVHWTRGDCDGALKWYEESLNICEKIGVQDGISNCLASISAAHHDKGEFDKALEYLEKSLEIREKIGHQPGIAASLNDIGTVYYELGECDKALEYFEKALEISEKIGDQWGVSTCLSNIGDLYLTRGKLDEALEYLRRSLEMRTKIGDQRGLTYNYCEIAEAYVTKEEFGKAREYCEKALSLCKEIGLKGNLAIALKIHGVVHTKEKKWDEALESFENSIKIFKETGMEKELGESFYELGLMWDARSESEKAKTQLNNALEIFKKLKLNKNIEKVKKELERM